MGRKEIRSNPHAKRRFQLKYNPVFASWDEAFKECYKIALFMFGFFALITVPSAGPFFIIFALEAYKQILLAFFLFSALCALACLSYKRKWFYILRVRIIMAFLLSFLCFLGIVYFCSYNQCFDF
ncbi:MAG: hypothetical protein DI626_08020 [Micavibrio aeruginosavorus]|uniref:Uncharacterized protein n=1 Tax=Micavibrio aeruginosavorus TaxID=349221 RepID=A0A2W4ZV61_9BACT|nr:MAG: hypothetical protein DI626_08020 [Micavibrio aeruginosavorus]